MNVKIQIGPSAIQMPVESLEQINNAIANCKIIDQKYIDGKYVDVVTDNTMQLQAALTIKAVYSLGGERIVE